MMGILFTGIVILTAASLWCGWEIGYYHGRFGAGRRS